MYRKSLFTGLLVAMLFGIAAQTTKDHHSFETTKNIELFTQMYKELNLNYVDELDPNKLIKIGIDAMLGSLDPYTNYITENQIERYRFMTEGKYNGIGSRAEKMGDYVTIVEIYQGLSADEAGIMVGDKIVAVEGQDTKGKSLSEVNIMLKGVSGTGVTLTIERYGEEEPIDIYLERSEVSVPNVPYSGMVDEKIGYVSLTTFTRGAGKNIVNRLTALKQQHPDMSGVILDLRGNGGGLLNEAISVSNIFIDRNLEVVTTKGKVKEWDKSYKTPSPAFDKEIPLVVLVNNRSASASEIVAGVIQDMDRGVIMGQRSFGKGLVQNTRDLGYNHKVKLTTAKYYIPSGRCIQAVEYENGNPVDIPDSLRAVFYTKNGRKVLDGGGIAPDVTLEKSDNSPFLRALDRQNLIFDYVTAFTHETDSIGSLDDFEYEEFDEFVNYVQNTGFTYTTPAEIEVNQLLAKANKEGISKEVDDEIQAILEVIDETKEDDFEEFKDQLIDILENEIASRYYYQKGKVKQRLKNDPEVKEAIALLLNPEAYNSYLTHK